MPSALPGLGTHCALQRKLLLLTVSWDLEWSYSLGGLGESFQGKDIEDWLNSPWKVNLFSLPYSLAQRFLCSSDVLQVPSRGRH